MPSDPVHVNVIPDIGESQEVVFTQWKGRSLQGTDDQITYLLTTFLLGIPGIKAISSNSMFGFFNIFVIFAEDIEYYCSCSMILEKLSALPWSSYMFIINLSLTLNLNLNLNLSLSLSLSLS